MVSLLGGLAILTGAGIAIFSLLPRGERYHRFVGTELEPYVSLAITAAIALGFTLTLAGVLGLIG